jgi:hypothetical protein
MGHSSEHIGLVCPKWRFADGQSRVAESSRHLSPKLRVFVDFLAANLVPAVEGEGDRAGDSAIISS